MDTTLQNISNESLTIRFPDDSWDVLVQHPKCVALKIKPVLDWKECLKRGFTEDVLKDYERHFTEGCLADENAHMVWCVDEKDACALADVINKYPTEILRGDNVRPASEVVEFLRKGAFRICRANIEVLPKKK